MGTNDARVALLERLIDHAPMFPPASLTVDEALAEDRRALASPHSFVLARLVWPASALEGLRAYGRQVSAVLDAPLPDAAEVEAVEARYRDDLELLGRPAPTVYVEVPIDGDLDGRLDQVGAHGYHAKVRCGGDVVPDAGELARFVRACRERALPFKATAGLHRAVRTDGAHGFLNLLAAAVFGNEEAALSEGDSGAFRVDSDAFRWRDRSASPERLAGIRRNLLHAVGSCSFFEPVAELESLGMLP